MAGTDTPNMEECISNHGGSLESREQTIMKLEEIRVGKREEIIEGDASWITTLVRENHENLGMTEDEMTTYILEGKYNSDDSRVWPDLREVVYDMYKKAGVVVEWKYVFTGSGKENSDNPDTPNGRDLIKSYNSITHSINQLNGMEGNIHADLATCLSEVE